MKSKSVFMEVLNGCGMVLMSVALVHAAESLTPAEAKARFEAARLEVASVRSNIVLTLEQLDQVRYAKDPQGQLEKFRAQLTNMEAQVKLVGARTRAMKEKGDLYFADWEARMAQIPDPDGRRWAAARYAERKKSYDRIVVNLQQAREDFTPLLSELQQIEALLQGGREPARVAAAKDLFMHANWHCVDVQRSLMQVEAELNFLAADFALHEK